MTALKSESPLPVSSTAGPIIIGSVAYDSIETPTGRRADMLGGSATFFSLAASIFTRPSLVAVVGEDFSDADRGLLRARQVDTSGLQTAPGRTFRWGGKYHTDMNKRDTLFTELNVFEGFEPVLNEAQKKTRFVFLGNIQPKLQLSVLDQVEAPVFVAADTMNLWIDIARPELLKVLSRINALFLNDEEAQQLTGEPTTFRAARAIQKLGPQMVIVKLGEHGVMMFNGEDTFCIPAFPLYEVVDPTGAGDTFAGAFVGHLAATEDLSPKNIRKAAVLGNLMASFCVQGYGVERIIEIDRNALKARYNEFRGLTRFDDF